MLFTMQRDVLIYFEHVARELDSCLKLKYDLEKIGLSAEVLPVHRNRYINTVKYQPKVIVMPFLFADENDRTWEYFKACYGENVICINFHHEQFYNETTKSHFMPKNRVSIDAYHISWTEGFKKDLIESGVDPAHINVTGNPRTDNFYLKPNIQIAKLKGKYKKLIFIPTSFSWVFVDEDYFLKNAKLDPIKFHQQKAVALKTVPIFFGMVREMAKKYSDYCFVLRPHPFENIQLYYDTLRSIGKSTIEPNILVNRESNVYDWLNLSDLVIGWFTTVSMEATLFNVKNVIYQPVKIPDFMQMEFITLYDTVYSEVEQLDYILKNISSFHPSDNRLREYIRDSFGIADGKVNERIAEWIAQLVSDVRFSNSNNARLKILVKALFVDIPKNIMIKTGLINRYNPIFSGIKEDLLSKRQISRKYLDFKKRIIL